MLGYHWWTIKLPWLLCGWDQTLPEIQPVSIQWCIIFFADQSDFSSGDLIGCNNTPG